MIHRQNNLSRIMAAPGRANHLAPTEAAGLQSRGFNERPRTTARESHHDHDLPEAMTP
jgi:hypothetical protein